MKTTISALDRYKEEDHQQLLHIVTIGHFLLAVILLMPDIGGWASNRPGQICLFYALSFLAINHNYNWERHSYNIILILAYLALLVGELYLFSIPGIDYFNNGYTYKYSTSHSQYKGVMLDFFLLTLPFIYVVLRVCLLFPVIQMTIWKNRH